MALEKNDVEKMVLLRSVHEIKVIEATRLVRDRQIAESLEAKNALEKTKAAIEERRNFYRDIQKIIPNEQMYKDKLQDAKDSEKKAQLLQLLASVAHAVPMFNFGIAGA